MKKHHDIIIMMQDKGKLPGLVLTVRQGIMNGLQQEGLMVRYANTFA